MGHRKREEEKRRGSGEDSQGARESPDAAERSAGGFQDHVGNGVHDRVA